MVKIFRSSIIIFSSESIRKYFAEQDSDWSDWVEIRSDAHQLQLISKYDLLPGVWLEEVIGEVVSWFVDVTVKKFIDFLNSRSPLSESDLPYYWNFYIENELNYYIRASHCGNLMRFIRRTTDKGKIYKLLYFYFYLI